MNNREEERVAAEWTDKEIEQWVDEVIRMEKEGTRPVYTVCELLALIEDSDTRKSK